jgi:hypothetical protein
VVVVLLVLLGRKQQSLKSQMVLLHTPPRAEQDRARQAMQAETWGAFAAAFVVAVAVGLYLMVHLG